MSEEPTTTSDKGMDLMALLVQRNVDDLAFTTDAIIRGKDEQILALAKTIKQIDWILSEALVIDRKTEDRLSRVNFWQASDILDRMKSPI